MKYHIQSHNKVTSIKIKPQTILKIKATLKRKTQLHHKIAIITVTEIMNKNIM